MAVVTLACVEPHPHLALAYGNEALELATRLNILEAIVNSHHVRGLALVELDRKDEAREAFTLACQLAQEHGLVLEATKYGLDLDRLNNDFDTARRRMQWFEERGLPNGVNMAKRYFPALEQAANTDRFVSEALPRLNVLGPMQISHEGEPAAVRGRKRQEFLASLLESRLAGRSEISRLELVDSLYPNEDEIKALQNLKNLAHGLRSSLGDGSILTTNTGYTLGAMTSDAEEFLKTGDTSLWRGAYLEDIETKVESVRDSLYLALFEKAKAWLETDSQEAARVARFLLIADPYNASYIALNVRALRARDNYRTLKQIYREANERFAEMGEPLPENWLDFLELTDKTPVNLS
jgi:hypothetical protein